MISKMNREKRVSQVRHHEYGIHHHKNAKIYYQNKKSNTMIHQESSRKYHEHHHFIIFHVINKTTQEKIGTVKNNVKAAI